MWSLRNVPIKPEVSNFFTPQELNEMLKRTLIILQPFIFLSLIKTAGKELMKELSLDIIATEPTCYCKVLMKTRNQ